MTITYINHSGFFVELDTVCLLFDYWQGPLPEPVPGKALLAFASHRHMDHYNPEIFAYAARWQQAKVILGNDIRLSAKRKEALGITDDAFLRMAPARDETVLGVRVRTLRSTDAGVAFLVEADGRTVYHAGDLNWWIWEAEPEDAPPVTETEQWAEAPEPPPAQTEPPAEESETPPAEEAEPQTVPAPDFTVFDPQGNPVRLSEYQGKPVVLNFWASWCTYCKLEMPAFEEKFLELGEEVTFLMVNVTGGQETQESAAAYIAEQGYTFPVYYDLQQEAAMAYGTYSLPVTYFIDAAGSAVAYAAGAINAETLQRGIDLIR